MLEAIVVIQREIGALTDMQKRLDRQLEKLKADSKQAQGARQAREVTVQRIAAMHAAIAVLRRVNPDGDRR